LVRAETRRRKPATESAERRPRARKRDRQTKTDDRRVLAADFADSVTQTTKYVAREEPGHRDHRGLRETGRRKNRFV